MKAELFVFFFFNKKYVKGVIIFSAAREEQDLLWKWQNYYMSSV